MGVSLSALRVSVSALRVSLSALCVSVSALRVYLLSLPAGYHQEGQHIDRAPCEWWRPAKLKKERMSKQNNSR